MKKIIFLLFMLVTPEAFGQMNFQDSSVQIISFWDLGENYNYSVSLQKIKYSDKDTISNETITYNVDVSVIDSTANSYTIRWFYKDFKSNSSNPIVQKLVNVTDDIAVEILLDELGVIQSVKNWQEVREYLDKSLDTLKKDFGVIPNMEKIFQQMENMYSTKASIEASAIQDVQQFHNFHGGNFFLNQKVTGQIATPNLYYVDKPFDTDVSVVLEELDQENNEYIIRSIQEVNSEQLTETTFQYLKNMTESLGKEFVKREDFKELSNTVETVSRIHNTGWVLKSILWKEVVSDGITNMEIRKIQMN